MSSNSDKKLKVLLSSFQCDENGVSEAYLGSRWYEGLKKSCDMTLLTGTKSDIANKLSPSHQWHFKNKYLNRINSAIKFDYFWFNRLSVKELKNIVSSQDVLHHVSPVAPRYPVSIAKYANRFILGPIAGGLRVPEKFASEVEGAEELFFKLRQFDKARFKFDKALISTYDRADTILIAGDYLFEMLPQRFHSKCIKMMDVGIDTNLYGFSEREISSSTFRLLYVGRVVPYKGLIYLLRAIASLPAEIRNNIRLDIAGNQGASSYEAECKKFIAMNFLESNVVFHGFLSKVNVELLYDKAHLFCFPSLAEAGGTVVLEAMAKGLPILSINYGGPAQSVDETCGVLIDPTSPVQLVDELRYNLITFYENMGLIKQLGAGARLRAESNFDWEVRCKRMMSVYENRL